MSKFKFLLIAALALVAAVFVFMKKDYSKLSKKNQEIKKGVVIKEQPPEIPKEVPLPPAPVSSRSRETGMERRQVRESRPLRPTVDYVAISREKYRRSLDGEERKRFDSIIDKMINEQTEYGKKRLAFINERRAKSFEEMKQERKERESLRLQETMRQKDLSIKKGN